ncbi:MAG TPA: RusA family crossover junction endodeoxyribonuclease [Gemmatimonadaceae bacterium]|jgi:crossover junction endodeoxyribonuclease RusA|nr:RusA family crossover junction endodeoxyribonuclease [Gemmatimonadaceae bacterium]
MALTFTVFGIAQTKGSTRAFVPKGWTRPIITNTNRNAKSWEALVAEAANRALTGRGQLFHGAIELAIAFYLPRPKSLPRTKTVPHIKAPDVDKLARCCVDALSGVVFRDDAQVTELIVSKQYAAIGESPRAIVTIEPLSAAEQLPAAGAAALIGTA